MSYELKMEPNELRNALNKYVTRRATVKQATALKKLKSCFVRGERYSAMEIRRIISLEMNKYKVNQYHHLNH